MSKALVLFGLAFRNMYSTHCTARDMKELAELNRELLK